jgi:hypothetical protein
VPEGDLGQHAVDLASDAEQAHARGLDLGVDSWKLSQPRFRLAVDRIRPRRHAIHLTIKVY